MLGRFFNFKLIVPPSLGVRGLRLTFTTQKFSLDVLLRCTHKSRKTISQDVKIAFQEVKNNYRIRGTTPEIEQAARKLRNNLTSDPASAQDALGSASRDTSRSSFVGSTTK